MRCPRCHSDNADTSRFCTECGKALRPSDPIHGLPTKTIATPAAPIKTGELLAGKYRVIDEIGRGGMGVVVRAEDTRLKRTVALKFLSPELTGDPEARERFIQEARAASALEHPNICTVHEAEEHDGRAFIAMAYVEGQTLRQRVAKGPLPVGQAVEIAIQVAEGLAEAHRKGIVHRDIKSANIMVTDQGQAKIMDFGLAKVSGGSLITKDAGTMGTVAYMSPEQARSEAVDHRTDIWSLGVVLYEMVTSELPFGEGREASILYSIIHEEPRPFAAMRPPVPLEWQKIVGRALRKKPEARYPSAVEMLEDLRGFRDALKAEELGIFNIRTLWKRLRRPRTAVPAALVLVAVAALVTGYVDRRAKVRWAEQDLLPQIQQLIEEGTIPTDWRKMSDAFDLAQKARRYVPDNPEFLRLWSLCAFPVSVRTDPPGAKVYVKPYATPDDEWRYLGISPLEKVPFPMAYVRWKLEKEGHETVFAASCTITWSPATGFEPLDLVRTLDPTRENLAGMVRVPGWEDRQGTFPDFYIDTHEVTNREFKKFVGAGGYNSREFWKHEFVKDGRTMTWEEAMPQFLDATGRPGPATWQAGDHPDGQEDHPVTGVSWYEAAAYAEFAGKGLPTSRHWVRATGMDIGLNQILFPSLLFPLSNIGGDRPEKVGAGRGLMTYGTYDMFGNVREWCSNEVEDGRLLMGGAWGDISIFLENLSKVSPFDRCPQNGFRCALYPDKDRVPESAFLPVRRTLRDFYSEKPVPDEVFRVYRDQFSYDKKDLAAEIEEEDSLSETWIKQRATFTAAYDDDRMIVYLYLPKNVAPPYQTVIVFPGVAAFYNPSSRDLEKKSEFGTSRFLVKDGRAIVHPVYVGTYERKKGFTFQDAMGNESHRYVEYLSKLIKDFRRTIDYLESRPDIDARKIAFYGFSWGGRMAGIIPAVEDRLKLNISYVGGLLDTKFRPEASEINYIPRVKIPTLMLNGEYDLTFPYETNAKPMFDLLGTPPEHKRLVLFKADHNIPVTDLAREILPWLDRYFGPPKRDF